MDSKGGMAGRVFHKAQTRRHLPGGRPMGGGRIMLPP